jgi:hypothetical protein
MTCSASLGKSLCAAQFPGAYSKARQRALLIAPRHGHVPRHAASGLISAGRSFGTTFTAQLSG